MKLFCCHCIFVGGGYEGVSVLDGFLLQVIAEKIKIYSYIPVGEKSLCTGFSVNAGLIPSACTVEFI